MQGGAGAKNVILKQAVPLLGLNGSLTVPLQNLPGFVTRSCDPPGEPHRKRKIAPIGRARCTAQHCLCKSWKRTNPHASNPRARTADEGGQLRGREDEGGGSRAGLEDKAGLDVGDGAEEIDRLH